MNSDGKRERSGAAGDRPIRVVFFGTPEFAVPALAALATAPSFEVVAAVTQPDRPSGRGRRLEASAVKQQAEALNLSVLQPATLGDATVRATLRELEADLFVVAAYGRIFGPKTLAIPHVACVNLHASLLPDYRGASPIAAAVLAGERRTGVSLMVMEPGLDTGPVINVMEEEIRADDTTGTLTPRLGERGAALAVQALPAFVRGETAAIPQGPGGSLTRPLQKADGWLDWRLPADHLERQIRAMSPWPRGWTTSRGETLQIHRATVVQGPHDEVPGTLRVSDGAPEASCGSDWLRLDVIQPPGGRPMSGADLVRGRKVDGGELLGGAPPPQLPPFIVPVE